MLAAGGGNTSCPLPLLQSSPSSLQQTPPPLHFPGLFVPNILVTVHISAPLPTTSTSRAASELDFWKCIYYNIIFTRYDMI